MAFTYDGLISEIKQETNGLMGIHVPMKAMHYWDFVENAGLNPDTYYSLDAYINQASYQEKRDTFESLGFKVLYLTLSAVKVIHYIEGRADGAPNDPSIEEAFLDNKRNVFILDIETGMKSLYFVIEYQSEDALAKYTVDQEKLARELEQKEQVRALFGRTKKKETSDSSIF